MLLTPFPSHDHQVTEYHPSHHHFHRPNTSLQFDTMVGSILQSRCSFASCILETELIAFMPMLTVTKITIAERRILILTPAEVPYIVPQ